MNELFKDSGRRHLPIDSQLLPAVKLDPVLTALHPHLEPLPHQQVVHVHELHTDRSAIGVVQPPNDLPQRHRLRALDGIGREHPVHVLFGQVIESGVEFREARPGTAQRIDIGREMPPDPVGTHQLVNPVLQEGKPLIAAPPHGIRQRGWLFFTRRCVGQRDNAFSDRHRVTGGNAFRRDHGVVLKQAHSRTHGGSCWRFSRQRGGRRSQTGVFHHRWRGWLGRQHSGHGMPVAGVTVGQLWPRITEE